MSVVKERESGVELLRIFAAMAVVILHFCFPGAFGALKESFSILPTDKTIVLGGFESISVCAVNVFILITGYFLSTNMHRSIGKPLCLLIQLIVIKTCLWLVGLFTGNHEFTFSGLLIAALPKSYFVSLYIALYFISPYLNYVIKSFSLREWKVFIMILFILFSLWEIIINIGGDVIKIDLGSMSAISHWGGQCGHTIVNFSFLYCLGAFLRLNRIQMKTYINFLGFIITSLLLFLWLFVELQFKTEITSFTFGYYYNPLIILQSVFLFSLFRNMTFKSIVINELAKGAFTCYLINSLLTSKLGGGVLAVKLSTFNLFLFVIASAIGTYLMAYLMFKIYNWFTLFFPNKIDNYKIKYFDKE